MSSASSLHQKCASLAAFLVAVAGLALLVMMALTVVDVLGRYFTSRSLTGSNEMIRIALAVSVSCALPAAALRGEHIMLGLLSGPAEHPLERLRGVVVWSFCAVVFVILSWMLWRTAMKAMEFEDVIGYLELPLAPMILVIAFMALISGIIFLFQAWNALFGVSLKSFSQETSS